MNIDEAIEFFQSGDDEAGFEERRYPACIMSLNGVVAIADEDSNGSNLEMMTEDSFLRWMLDAKELFERIDDDEFGDPYTKYEAINETRPDNILRESH
jgi:hypothetical protein